MRTERNTERTIEPRDTAGTVKRFVRALGRRVAEHDPYQLEHLVECRRELEAVTRQTVQALHEAGYSWAEIARPLGITRQAAQQAYGRKDTA